MFKDQIKIPIACPKCSEKFIYSIRDLEAGKDATCPKCATQFKVTGGEELKKVAQASDRMENSLKKLGKKRR